MDLAFTEWGIYHMLSIYHIACVYNTLLTGSMFYLPSSHVRNTAEVEMDYIAFQKLRNVSPTGITYNGINVGIRECGDFYVPLTILISTNSNVVEYNQSPRVYICVAIPPKQSALFKDFQNGFLCNRGQN